MLAQSWLYGQRAPSPRDHYLEKRLKLPDKFNPHTPVVLLNNIAERIVFTDDVPTILYDMWDNRQLTYEGVIGSAKLPFDCFWIEYATIVGLAWDEEDVKRAHYGALIQRIQHDRVQMHIVIGMEWKNEGIVSTLAYVCDFHQWPPLVKNIDGKTGLQFDVVYAFNRERLESCVTSDGFAFRGDIVDLGNVVSELIFGIFLVTQPKVYTDEQVTFKPSHKRARAEKGKPPLLEYRKIRLRITKPHKRYTATTGSSTGERATAIRSTDRYIASGVEDTESDSSIQHRRYHKVMGHFRHYLNSDPPRTIWIEPFYRGDPALGITFTERDVSK